MTMQKEEKTKYIYTKRLRVKMKYTIKMHRTMGRKIQSGEKKMVTQISKDGVNNHQENAVRTCAEFRMTSKNKDSINIS